MICLGVSGQLPDPTPGTAEEPWQPQEEFWKCRGFQIAPSPALLHWVWPRDSSGLKAQFSFNKKKIALPPTLPWDGRHLAWAWIQRDTTAKGVLPVGRMPSPTRNPLSKTIIVQSWSNQQLH